MTKTLAGAISPDLHMASSCGLGFLTTCTERKLKSSHLLCLALEVGVLLLGSASQGNHKMLPRVEDRGEELASSGVARL